MLGEMITAHETLSTVCAHESLFSSMGAKMSLKLIGTREALATEQPVADEGTFTRMPSKMRLEMRGLPVDFPAAWDVTDVLLLLCRVTAGVLTVRAATTTTATRGEFGERLVL